MQISYGAPIPSPQREWIWLGDVSGDQALATFAAPNARHEEYELQIVLHVEKVGENTQGTTERCYALLAELENQLRTDSTINAAVKEAHLGSFRLTEFFTTEGRIAELTVQVNCQAWI